MNEVIDIKNKKKKFKIKEKMKSLFSWMFKTNKNAIISLISMISFVMFFYFLYIAIFADNFYNNWSDDSLQYYPFMCDFIDSIKKGTFSLYNIKNYLGSSFFGDTYYIPLDIFTLIIFVLSLVMNTEVAMSIVEIVKMIAGVWAISKFLSMKGYKPKTVFLIGLFYFSSAGITCFSCFPCFTSLAFYLPFSLIIVELFIRKKWYYTPLYSMALVFYNFYLAYTVFAFMAFACLYMLIMERKKFLRLALDLIIFVLCVVLGLIMGMCVFLPSIKFVLSSTSRDIASGGSIKGLVYILYGYLDLFITLIVSFFKLIFNLFTTKSGLFSNMMVFDNSFIQVRYIYHTLQDERIFNDVTVMESFFETFEYYRMLSTTFTPLTASSFYGYQSSYFIEHFSFYVTGIGLLVSVYLWFMKDYKSRIYKILIIMLVIMMLLPFFSYILSANLEVLYTRWFNVVMIPLLLIDAHVIEEHGSILNLKPKKLLISLIIMIYLGILAAYNHLDTLYYFGVENNWDIEALNFLDKMFYLTLVAFGLVIVLMVAFLFIVKIKNKPLRIIFKSITPSIIGLSILFIGYIVLKYYINLPEGILDNLSVSGELFSVDDQITFQYLIFVTLMLMVLGAYAIIKHHKIMISIIVTLEFIFSACLSFGSCVIFEGKEETFENTHGMSEFVEEYIEKDDIYRIYVDSSCGDYLDTNTARLMPKGTNQDIFHSFINAETDGVAGLIFDKYDEGQAGKEALNTYSYFLNVLLGYKYVLCSTSSSFKNYDNNQFELKAIDEENNLMLLEFKDYEEFLVYDSYLLKDDFISIKSKLKSLSREKEMINSVIIDNDYLEYINDYYFNETDKNSLKDETDIKTFSQRKYFESVNEELITVDGDKYFRYSFDNKDKITTRSYAINIFGLDDRKNELIDNNRIYIEFKNGEKYYLNEENIKSMQGSTFHVPIYGNSDKEATTPVYLYVYAENQATTIVESLRYTVEGILAPVEYYNEYESGNEIPNDMYLEAAVRFLVNETYSDGILNFEVCKYSSSQTSLSYDQMYIEYETGEIEPLSKEITVSSDIKIKYIYVVKSNDILDLTNPPTLKITKYVNDNKYEDSFIDKSVTIKGSKITASYINNTNNDGYSLIMIPIAYSDEFEIVKGDVEMILPVNGGFMGIVVKNDIKINEIVLKFRPEGLNSGIKYSLIGITAYLVLLVNTLFYRKKKGETKCQL